MKTKPSAPARSAATGRGRPNESSAAHEHFRREKERRSRRTAPDSELMEAAKREYLAVLEGEAGNRRGLARRSRGMTEPGIADPAPWTRDRRVERSRRTIELAIDTVIRPGSWAAKIAYELGLQGRVRSRTHRFDLGRLRRDAVRPTLRVAFAADFHAGATTDERVLADAGRKLAAFEPDLVLLGGDFVSVRA